MGSKELPEGVQPAGVHIVGSSVNLPDMTASLKAKVSVDHAAQSDPVAMAAIYESMARRFLEQGLSREAVVAMRQYFAGVPSDEECLDGAGPASLPDPTPLAYGAFPTPLPPSAVRLGVFFIRDC
ncbi:hypothetical protein H632_c1668p1, partial [Helicosporidium sp. ATCC 50920]